MKLRLLRSFALAAALLAAACATSSTAAAVRRPDLDGLDAVVLAAMAKLEIPGLALAIVDDGGVVVAKGYGVRAVGSDEPVDADTLFDIGSITKAFTATAVAMLVDEGVLAWSDKITARVPGFSLADDYVARELTLADVASHRVGWADDYFYDLRPDMGRDEFLARLGRTQPDHAFRAVFEYSNAFFELCGIAVEAAAGTPWAAFIAERLLAPLGMQRTCTSREAADVDPNRARPHRLETAGMVALTPRRDEPLPSTGAICSTANDMAKWCRFVLDAGRADAALPLAAATVRAMRTLHVSGTFDWFDTWAYGQERCGYGLGWMLHDYRGDADQHVAHGGATSGMQSWLVVSPKHRYGIVLLSNGGWAGDRVHFAIANWIHDRWLGLEPVDWVGGPLAQYRERYDAWTAEQDAERRVPPSGPTARALDDYVGTYDHPTCGPLVLRREGESLVAELGIRRGALLPRGGDAFFVDWGELDVQNGTMLFAVRDGIVTRITYDDGIEFVFTR